MKTYPLDDVEKIKDIADYLIDQGNKRNYLLYMFGLHVGPRVEEYLSLKVRDVRDDRNRIVEQVELYEHKKSRTRKLKLSKELRDVLKDYVEGMRSYEYLFESQKATTHGASKPISRQQAFNILNDAGDYFGVRLSPHVLRKTFAMALYESCGRNILIPMTALGHTTPKQTMDYLCLTEENVNEYVEKLSFHKRK